MTIRSLLFALTAAPLVAQPNLLFNGDFESGPTIPPGNTELTVFGTEIPGWTVVSGNVDYNSAFWCPTSGSRSIDLHGIDRGAIEQAFATMPGTTYEVVFDLGARNRTRTVQLTAAGQTSQPLTGGGGTTGCIVSYSSGLRWSFVAVGASTVLRFDSLSPPGADGPHLDHVRVHSVAGPAGFTRFGSGCAGTAGVPQLASQDRPILGTTMTVDLVGLPAGITSVPFGCLGVSDTGWAGLTLPLALDPLGASGCSVLVSVDSVFQLGNNGGAATWPITIPNRQSVMGVVFYVQGVVLDPFANPLGIVLTNAGRGVVGAS